MSHQNRRKTGELPDLNETKAHIFVAGHELLKAAEGALKFCKSYVETTSTEKPHPQLIQFFSKAINVAGELGFSMMKGTSLKDMMAKTMRPLCDTIEQEMRKAKTHATHKTTSKKRKKK